MRKGCLWLGPLGNPKLPGGLLSLFTDRPGCQRGTRVGGLGVVTRANRTKAELPGFNLLRDSFLSPESRQPGCQGRARTRLFFLIRVITHPLVSWGCGGS